MIMRIKNIFVLLVFVIPTLLSGSETTYKKTLHWNEASQILISPTDIIKIIDFEGSRNEIDNDFLPQFFVSFPLTNSLSQFEIEILHPIYAPLDIEETLIVENSSHISEELKIFSQLSIDRKKPFAQVSFIPIRKNEITGMFEKLIQFSILVKEYPGNSASVNNNASGGKENSVLSTGNWYKVSVTESGIHKITQAELASMGIDVASIDPKHIRIYGLTGGMLPENLNTFRYDDLQQLAIHVEGEEDGDFGSSDFVLFYGRSPHVWKYNEVNDRMDKHLNLYADKSYYFITTDLGAGKRIETLTSSGLEPNNYISSFIDGIHHELEQNNLLSTGRIWYGEKFDLTLEMEQQYSIPDLDLQSPLTIFSNAAARSEISSSFSIKVNEVTQLNLSIPAVNFANYNGDYARERSGTSNFDLNTTNISVQVKYNKPTNSSIGYFDYYTLNFKRKLQFSSGQLIFRDASTINQDMVSEYTLSKANDNVKVWEVTNPLNAKKINTTLSSTTLKWVLESDSLQEFIAFDGSSYYAVNYEENVANQNLHSLKDIDMVILVHPEFEDEANRLADFRRTNDNLTIFITNPSQIYNEFSSGAQDVTAIRDFMKHVYDNSTEGMEIKYLLLFGDASFDYKDRIEGNINFIPTWESPESLNPVNSHNKDDFFGTLDGPNDNSIDIGIGRFVVSTASQAKTSVDKVIYYSENTPEVMGDWRNILCMIADDEDGGLHLEQADDLTSLIEIMNPALNIEKIYLDAYPQVSTSSGERYPGVTRDINTRVDRGALIMNYVGHGGEGGLAHERILTINDINQWKNLENMPVFMTATCEFSRFDDPARVSAGEYIFLNKNGGGIALFTTTRATYAGSNKILNENFYKVLLYRVNGEYKRMGDVLREAKNLSGISANSSKFVLLGDPSQKLAFPEQSVITMEINDIEISEVSDTIKALSNVTIKGEMQDYEGNMLADFNGTLYPTVFDKPSKYTTLGNDPGSSVTSFYMQNNALYKGKASIKNGNWEFNFLAPKDLAYQYGFGKLSFYAHNDTEDGNGYYDEVVVGGYNEFAESDNHGPEIELYMNDESFISGGLTDSSPKLLAFVNDENGINTVGSGIGHDIIATLDENELYTLNNFYEAELDNYKSGTISYSFKNLDNGLHNLSLKVWDNYNNSSTAAIEFLVASSEEMAINSLLNYPNPFTQYTTFSFEHNQVDQAIDVAIYIYSFNGQLVKVIDDIYQADGYKYVSEKWDGTNEYGSQLANGMFIYKVLITNYDGTVVEKTNKLVLIR